VLCVERDGIFCFVFLNKETKEDQSMELQFFITAYSVGVE
jgi:hypothetical protein